MKNQKSRTLPHIEPADPADLWRKTQVINEAQKNSRSTAIQRFLLRWRLTLRIWFHR